MVFVIKNKSDVFDWFKTFVVRVEAQFNKKVSTSRCDRGGEYRSKEFQEYCDKKGIHLQFTSGYSPQQNVVAERLNRTLLERTRALLEESGLPKSLWGYAVQTAVFVVNRSPTSAIEETKTPAELFYSKKPDIGKLKVFGSLAFKLIPKALRKSKLDRKNEVCVLIGYTDNGYVLWSPLDNSIKVSRS